MTMIRGVFALALGGMLALGGALAAGVALAGQPLVGPDWLAAHLKSPDVVVLDIRNRIDGGSREKYEAGHIPGAVYSNYLTGGWRIKKDGVPGMLPPVEDLEKLIGGLGIANDNHVVIVPGGVSALDYGSAARVYWTFKVLGHDKVSILNGGYRGWTGDASRPVEKGSATRPPATFKAHFRRELLASRDEVLAAYKSGKVALIDNRPPAQFEGKAKHPAALRYGTIPGARNMPQGRFFNASTGQFADVKDLEALWQSRKVAEDGEQITYCNTGHWAALGWFTVSELFGNKKVKMYDGSMTEWSRQPDLPMVKGASPVN